MQLVRLTALSCSTFALLVVACSASIDDAGRIPPYDGAGASDRASGPGEPASPSQPAGPPSASPAGPNSENPGALPLDMSPEAMAPPGAMVPSEGAPERPVTPQGPLLSRPTRGTDNLFTDLLGIPEAEVSNKVRLAANRIFGIGTNESATPVGNSGYRLYYELPQDPSMAFIWAADSNDIRSEGMSYGMMIAVQLDMQEQFDRVWKFAQTFMQFPANGNLTAWRYYFRWQGSVNTSNAASWAVNYGAQTGPAPDGDEYFAAALYLADRRWGSGGSVNYRQQADNIAAAMLNNPTANGRTPIIDRGSNMVVFYPQGGPASYSDPSYHLPAFYEIFAQDGPQNDSDRWRQVASISRQYFVTSANAATGLHPDYADFNGTPNAGGANHDQFRFDAWRVVMNMAVDYAWGSADARLKTQTEKYHTFFTNQLAVGNVRASLFALNGNNPSGGGSTALTATLAAGALASDAPNRARYVENLWAVNQQSGLYRYYQETVYMLGLLSVAGRFGYEWSDATP